MGAEALASTTWPILLTTNAQIRCRVLDLQTLVTAGPFNQTQTSCRESVEWACLLRSSSVELCRSALRVRQHSREGLKRLPILQHQQGSKQRRLRRTNWSCASEFLLSVSSANDATVLAVRIVPMSRST